MSATEKTAATQAPATTMGKDVADGNSEQYIDPVKERNMMRKFDVSETEIR